MANTYAPDFVGVPLRVAVLGLKVRPSGKATLSKELAQVTAYVEQAGTEVESVLSSKVAAG